MYLDAFHIGHPCFEIFLTFFFIHLLISGTDGHVRQGVHRLPCWQEDGIDVRRDVLQVYF